uniref:Ubiquitin ligase-like protein n=1 Tax=Adineta vaga TaxID=104782 RepID=B3G483_ADIVA|nr:ubiquitin ligase-like protein [Adineta vaga]
MLYLLKPTTVLNAYTIQQKSCEVYEHSLNWLKRYKSMIEIQTLNNYDVMFYKCDLLIDFPFMEYKCPLKARAAILLQSNAILYSFNGIVSIFTELCKTMMHTVQCKDRFKQDLVDSCDRSFNKEEEYPYVLLRFQFDYIHAESLCWCTREGFTYPSLNKILKANIGNLISMNEFLSISTNRKVAYLFAKSASCSLDPLRFIFRMTFDISYPSKSNNSFNEEILLLPHTNFRIDKIKRSNSRLWIVYLTFVNNYNKCFAYQTESYREEEMMKCRQLCSSMPDMDELEKTTNLHELLSKINSYNSLKDRIDIYSQNLYSLNAPKYDYVYNTAQKHLNSTNSNELSIELWKSNSSPHLFASPTYQKVSISKYRQICNYSTVMIISGTALITRFKALRSYYSLVNLQHGSLNQVLIKIGSYCRALSRFKLSSNICQDILAQNRLNLTNSFSSTGLFHAKMKTYSKTHSHYEKLLKTRIKTNSFKSNFCRVFSCINTGPAEEKKYRSARFKNKNKNRFTKK